MERNKIRLLYWSSDKQLLGQVCVKNPFVPQTQPYNVKGLSLL
jgi:hypothetical protein